MSAQLMLRPWPCVSVSDSSPSSSSSPRVCTQKNLFPMLTLWTCILEEVSLDPSYTAFASCSTTKTRSPLRIRPPDRRTRDSVASSSMATRTGGIGEYVTSEAPWLPVLWLLPWLTTLGPYTLQPTSFSDPTASPSCICSNPRFRAGDTGRVVRKDVSAAGEHTDPHQEALGRMEARLIHLFLQPTHILSLLPLLTRHYLPLLPPFLSHPALLRSLSQIMQLLNHHHKPSTQSVRITVDSIPRSEINQVSISSSELAGKVEDKQENSPLSVIRFSCSGTRFLPIQIFILNNIKKWLLFKANLDAETRIITEQIIKVLSIFLSSLVEDDEYGSLGGPNAPERTDAFARWWLARQIEVN